MVRRWYIKTALFALVLLIIGFLVYCLAGLWAFSDLTEKKLVFSLIEGDSNYELYYIFEGALGSDYAQTVIDGEVYSNVKIEQGLNDARIESIIIHDSIIINIQIEEESIPIRIPL